MPVQRLAPEDSERYHSHVSLGLDCRNDSAYREYTCNESVRRF